MANAIWRSIRSLHRNQDTNKQHDQGEDREKDTQQPPTEYRQQSQNEQRYDHLLIHHPESRKSRVDTNLSKMLLKRLQHNRGKTSDTALIFLWI